MFRDFVDLVRKISGLRDGIVPLHAPVITSAEKTLVMEALDSSYVSSVGKHVDVFEVTLADYTQTSRAVATVNGTAALHAALHVIGVSPSSEVLTQSLTFVATCNAIRYCGANPVFVDIDIETMGMSPDSLRRFLIAHTDRRSGVLLNKHTGNPISACVPVHTYGHPCRIEEICSVCEEFGVPVIEDAAESLGSLHGGRHTGGFGAMGVLSFNGNKILTTGGGGMIILDDQDLADRLKHLTTTAKIPHPWLYQHDEVGFNYRMPNLNAALGLGQFSRLESSIESKRALGAVYRNFCGENNIQYMQEPENCRANFWLHTVLFKDKSSRDAFIEFTNKNGVMTRPAWCPMHLLPMYSQCERMDLSVTEFAAERLANLPSSPFMLSGAT